MLPCPLLQRAATYHRSARPLQLRAAGKRCNGARLRETGARLARPLRSQFVACNRIGYAAAVAIRSFRHKGLGRFFNTASKAGIQATHAQRLRLILGRLNVAAEPRDMNLPGLDLHPLKGDRRGSWAVRVSGSWRITFRFAGKDIEKVDYEDYH